jgi:hypothetical protein
MMTAKTVTWFEMQDVLEEAGLKDEANLLHDYRVPGGRGDTCLGVYLHPDKIPAFVTVFRPLAARIGLDLGSTANLLAEAKAMHSGAINTGVVLFWPEVQVES